MSKHLETPRMSPGMKETLDQLHELSGGRKPDIMAKLFAPKATPTPGPWQVMNEYDGATIVIANVDGETFPDGTSTFSYDFVCDTLPDDGDGSRSRVIAKANARLIAAAPDMLLALKQAEYGLELMARRQPGHVGLRQDLEAVRSAIAKATGGAS